MATELEGTILGIVSSDEPCSAYSVRRRYTQPSTWGWSSSKGAIYSAVARLVARGLLEATPTPNGRRVAAMLRITARGRRELRDWILSTSREMGGAPIDPIRTRVKYLAQLSAEERKAFLDRALASSRQALASEEDWIADPDDQDRWALLAESRGTAMQLEAKIQWLEELRHLKVWRR